MHWNQRIYDCRLIHFVTSHLKLHLNQTHEPFLIQLQTRLPSHLDLPKLRKGSINAADPKFVRPTHTTKHGHKLELTHTHTRTHSSNMN